MLTKLVCGIHKFSCLGSFCGTTPHPQNKVVSRTQCVSMQISAINACPERLREYSPELTFGFQKKVKGRSRFFFCVDLRIANHIMEDKGAWPSNTNRSKVEVKLAEVRSSWHVLEVIKPLLALNILGWIQTERIARKSCQESRTYWWHGKSHLFIHVYWWAAALGRLWF